MNRRNLCGQKIDPWGTLHVTIRGKIFGRLFEQIAFCLRDEYLLGLIRFHQIEENSIFQVRRHAKQCQRF